MSSSLDSMTVRLKATGFYNDKPVKIILCNGDGKSAFFDKISMATPGAGFHHFSGNIFLHPKRIEQFRRENAKVTGEELMLIEDSYQAFVFEDILTHEILHKLHADKMGILEFRRKLPPPHWKAEGFAEYYSHRHKINEDSGRYFKQQCALYLKYKDKFPLFYLRARLLYEYLVVYEHLSFEEIMSDEIDEVNTFEKMNRMLSHKENL